MTISTTNGNRPTAPKRVKPPRQKGWYIPWIFVGLFMIVLTVSAIMVHFAVSSWTGVQAEFTTTEPRKALIAITALDKEGRVLKDAEVTVSMIRPTTVGHDKTLTLPYLGEGRYGAPVELDLEGQWDMRFVINHATGDYQDQKRVWLH